MKVAVFDTHRFERSVFEEANGGRHELVFLDTRLNEQTVKLAEGCSAVCLFVNDRADKLNLQKLADLGIKLLALRSAGFNHVDLEAAKKLGMTVVRVPQYSPEAVAEHSVALLLTLNRKIHKAYNRIHELNFSLDGLVGFNLHKKTVGVLGTGRIGKAFCQIMRGFGCRVLAVDIAPDLDWARANSVEYTDMVTLLQESLIISLHIPLNESTRHVIDAEALKLVRKNAVLVNTSRGALVDTPALIKALKRRQLGGACLDVYEEEAGIFFSDLSDVGITDDVLARLITLPNVLITSHQGFLTSEALENIAKTTIENLDLFEKGDSMSLVKV